MQQVAHRQTNDEEEECDDEVLAAKDAPARRIEGTSRRVRAASSVSVMNSAVSAKSKPAICVGISDPASTPTSPDSSHVRWNVTCIASSRGFVQPFGRAAVSA